MDTHLARADNEDKPTLMTVEEAAQYLRLHPSTVYRLVRLRKLPAVKVGKQWRLDRETLEGWLRENTSVRDDGRWSGPDSAVTATGEAQSD